MEYRFKIDRADLENTLTWEEYEVISSPSLADMRTLRKVIGRFMVDDKGEYIPQEKAFAELGALKFAEVKTVAEAFGKALNEAAVNPTTAAKS